MSKVKDRVRKIRDSSSVILVGSYDLNELATKQSWVRWVQIEKTAADHCPGGELCLHARQFEGLAGNHGCG